MNGNEAMDFGFGGIWGIIMLLIIAGLFGGNGFGFGNNARNDITNEFLYNQLANDVRANGQAINTTDRDVLTSSCNTDKEILESRYTTQLGFQQAQAQLSSCCCEIKSLIREDGEATRALITQNRISDLEKELVNANTIISNATQTQNILNQLGNFYPKSGVNPYSVYGYGYGTTIV